jgi:hypothetical protein
MRGEDRQCIGSGLAEQFTMISYCHRLGPTGAHARDQLLGCGPVGIGATHDAHAVKGHKPLEMHPRRQTATGDPDPKPFGRHRRASTTRR